MTATAALVVDIVDLPHRIGATKDVCVEAGAPAGLGTAVIGVPEGSSLVVDARLTSLEDGVLARGRADVHVHGECVRCLRDLDEERTVTFDELYYLPEAARAAEDGEDVDDVLLVGEDSLDLEPALRDALVPALPFRPLCRPDCAGLCPECGRRVDNLPADHRHDHPDPRWSALAALLPDRDGSDDPADADGEEQA
ncbi:YceD family protein [Actinomyces sp. oral taxon 448]|uniref:YceD family protein n=2 Tax=Actinomyces sp. oral taxon 448 TaxID=712124 RepID=UPI0002189296|nr:DUF177 domain-containing protein [Actinomyces sp. oral taxon 448]EGQ73387.1 hypothetical protein HMPREF9062_1938 [Actinomyces sp. oral taxon 448 str. F0400]